jgi:N-acetylmuramoyl-L-alanine amidase
MASAIYRAFKKYKLEFEAENKPKQGPETITVTNLEYRIQFFTDRVMLQLSDPRFKGLKELAVYEQNGLYKYTSGHFATFEEARNALHDVKSKGFVDAFVIAFQEGKRINVNEARKLDGSLK